MTILALVVGFLVGGMATAFVLIEAGSVAEVKWSPATEKRTLTMDPWCRGRLGSVLDMKFAREGELIPVGWGLAFRAWDRDAGVFMPVPFNVVVRWARRFWEWVQFDSMDAKAWMGDEIEARAIQRAETVVHRYEGAAYKRGQRDALSWVKQELQAMSPHGILEHRDDPTV